MHPSSITNMKRASKFVGNPKIILDVGGRGNPKGNPDRSYKSIFPNTKYLIADIVKGNGVTHIMPGQYTLPFHDNYFDLVVSGQTLEHVNNPFKLVAEMRRVTKDYIIIVAPSTGPRHDVQDCWRFMDDAFKAIGKDVGLEIIADWIDRKAPDERSQKWNDHVVVFRK